MAQRVGAPHLIGKDGVDAVIVHRREPAEAALLVLAHLHLDLLRRAHRHVLDEGSICLGARLHSRQPRAKPREHGGVVVQEGRAPRGCILLRTAHLLVPPLPRDLLGRQLTRRRRLFGLWRPRRCCCNGRPLARGKGLVGRARELAIPHRALALLHVVHVLPLDGKAVDHHH
eukprot:4081532-Prymnesium_polylepis.2